MSVDELREELDRGRENLWESEEWVPPFVEIDGRKQLDYSRVDGTLDAKAWAMYWAGKVEAYEHGAQMIEEDDDE